SENMPSSSSFFEWREEGHYITYKLVTLRNHFFNQEQLKTAYRSISTRYKENGKRNGRREKNEEKKTGGQSLGGTH
ncbi:hypothetical protein KI387_021547, partial [Taxus chinensis]